MSEDSKIVKKRGRPKKTAEVDTIILIDSSVSAEPTTAKTKSQRAKVGKTVVEPPELAVTSRKRVSRSSVVKDGAERKPTKPTKATRAKTSAKHTDNVIAPSGMESTVGVTISTLTTSTSRILEQATAFQNVVTELPVVKTSSQDLSSESTSSDEVIGNVPIAQDTIPVKRIDRPSLIDLQTRFDDIRRDLRRLTLKRIDVSLSQTTRFLEQSSTSITEKQAKWAEPLNSDSQSIEISTPIDSLEDRVQGISTETQEVPQTVAQGQQISEHSNIEKQPYSIEDNLTGQDPDLLSSTATLQDHSIVHRCEALDLQTNVSTEEIQQSSNLLNSLTTSSSTTISIPSNPTMSSPPDKSNPRSRPLTHSSSIKLDFPQAQPTSRPRPQPQVQPQPQPQPRPLRPTELPYEVLRKTPAFKRESRQWTGIIVGIPVLVATSWILYKRYQDTLTKRMDELSQEARRGRERGALPVPVAEAEVELE